MSLMSIIRCFLGLSFLLTVALQAQPVASAALQAAIVQAAAEQRLVLLEFFSYNSVESKMLGDRVLADPDVKALLGDKYIVVRAELEREPVLAAQFEVTKAPIVVLLAADGQEIDRVAGLARPADFLKTLEAAATGKSELAQLKEQTEAPDATVEQRVALAVAYAKRGNYADAVAEYSRSLDLSLQSREGARFRTGIARRLAALARQAPPEAEAIQAIRDRLEQEAIDGRAEAVAPAIELNNGLKASERNAGLYLKLPADSPLRRQVFPLVLQALVQAKHYEEIVTAVDLEAFTSSFYAMPTGHDHGHRAPLSPADHRHNHRHEPEAAAIEQRITPPVVASVEALLATGQSRKAQRIAGRALDYLQCGEIRSRLLAAASRAGGTDAAAFVQWMEQEYPPEALTQPVK
jgi:hypothetical protein